MLVLQPPRFNRETPHSSMTIRSRRSLAGSMALPELLVVGNRPVPARFVYSAQAQNLPIVALHQHCIYPIFALLWILVDFLRWDCSCFAIWTMADQGGCRRFRATKTDRPRYLSRYLHKPAWLRRLLRGVRHFRRGKGRAIFGRGGRPLLSISGL